MRGESMSGTTVTGTTLLRMALLFHLLRGALRGLEVLGHRRLDLSLLHLREVMPEVVAMDLAVVALSPVGWTTHVFTLVVFVPPKSIGALLLILS